MFYMIMAISSLNLHAPEMDLVLSHNRCISYRQFYSLFTIITITTICCILHRIVAE